jgi:hypothetical protein
VTRTERGTPVIVFRLPKTQASWKRLVEAMLLTVLFVSVLLFVVYQLADTKVQPDVPEMKEHIEFLGHELAVLSERFERSQARQTVLEQETEIVRSANRLLREEESRRQAELNRLQTELDFYHRLVGSGGELTGLAVYEAELIATDSPRVFRFILTLTQNIRRASIISGKARMDVEGTLGNRLVTLSWPQLNDGSTAEPPFRFKYFQQLEGYLTLPEDFSPIRLRVTLEVKGQREPVGRTFNWKNLLESTGKGPSTDDV